MSADLRTYLKGCLSCACSRATAKSRHGLMQLRDDVGYPGEVVSIDLAGPFPVSERGNRYVATFIDAFTLFTDIELMPTKEALSVAISLYKYVCRHGCPKRIMTDRGTEFINSTLKHLAEMLGIQRVAVTPYHHQAMGTVERVHKVFKEALRAYCETASQYKQWDLMLYGIVSALNATSKRKLGT